MANKMPVYPNSKQTNRGWPSWEAIAPPQLSQGWFSNNAKNVHSGENVHSVEKNQCTAVCNDIF